MSFQNYSKHPLRASPVVVSGFVSIWDLVGGRTNDIHPLIKLVRVKFNRTLIIP